MEGFVPVADQDDEPKTIASKLRDLRKSKRLSVKEAAQLLGDGIHFTTVSKLETGKMQITLDWLERFAKAYEVDIKSFIHGVNSVATPRLVDEYPFYDWPPRLSSTKKANQVYILDGGKNSFSLSLSDGFPDLADDFPEYSLTVDPDQAVLLAGATYAFFSKKRNVMMIGVYREGPARFVPYLNRLSLLTFLSGEAGDDIKVIGRVVTATRHLGSQIG